MARTFDASGASNYLYWPVDGARLLGVNEWTIFASGWVTGAGHMHLGGLYDLSAFQSPSASFYWVSSGGSARYELVNDAGSVNPNVGAVDVSSPTFHRVCGVTRALNAHEHYADGALAGTSSTDLVAFSRSLIDTLVMGGLAQGGGFNDEFNGKGGEWAVWKGAVSPGDAIALTRGVSPLLIRRPQLTFYAPMIRGARDLISGKVAIEVNFPGVSDHPTVHHTRLRRRRPLRAPSGGATTIEETGEGVITLGGAAAFAVELARTGAGGVTLGGTSQGVREIVRQGAGELALGGTAAPVIDLVRAGVGGVTFAGGLSPTIELTAQGAGGIAFAGAAAAPLTLSRDGAGGLTFAGTLAPVLDLVRTGAGEVAFAGAVSTNGTFSVVGTGTITFSGAATYEVLGQGPATESARARRIVSRMKQGAPATLRRTHSTARRRP